MRLGRTIGIAVVLLVAAIGSEAVFGVELHGSPNRSVAKHVAGTQLTNTANYQWYYGCSPTAAGMMMGYYDRNGYQGHSFDNLVPGGTAEATTFGTSSALVNSAIASSGHIADYYSAGINGYGDDAPTPTHSFDCLADFMGVYQSV